MRKIWRAIAQHRALAVLFAVYWVLAFGVCAGQLLDFQLLFRISLAYHPHPVLQGFILKIAYTIVFLGGLGGVLGLVGFVPGRLLRPHPITKTIFRQ